MGFERVEELLRNFIRPAIYAELTCLEKREKWNKSYVECLFKRINLKVYSRTNKDY